MKRLINSILSLPVILGLSWRRRHNLRLKWPMECVQKGKSMWSLRLF